MCLLLDPLVDELPHSSMLSPRSLFPLRPSKTIDLVESIPTAPISSKTEPCASMYEGFICVLLLDPLFSELPTACACDGVYDCNSSDA